MLPVFLPLTSSPPPAFGLHLNLTLDYATGRHRSSHNIFVCVSHTLSTLALYLFSLLRGDKTPIVAVDPPSFPIPPSHYPGSFAGVCVCAGNGRATNPKLRASETRVICDILFLVG